jgi:hypothetical protein
MKWQLSKQYKIIGREETHGGIIVDSTFTYYTCGQQGRASINCPWKEEI